MIKQRTLLIKACISDTLKTHERCVLQTAVVRLSFSYFQDISYTEYYDLLMETHICTFLYQLSLFYYLLGINALFCYTSERIYTLGQMRYGKIFMIEAF